MRVFVTGATGFVGYAVVQELLGAGHTVLGLARSEPGAQALLAAGAEVQRGDLEDLESLRRGAAASDAVIHTAFRHDWSRFAESCALDKRAIEAMGEVLRGSSRPFLITGGLAVIAPGRPAEEEDPPVPVSGSYPRASEATAAALEAQGVSTAVVRLPQVHDTARQGLISYLIAVAREKGVSAYVGEGQTRWAAVHRADAARLYRLALERHATGRRYHAVAEVGVTLQEIATTIGEGLQVPVRSIPQEQAQEHFGFLGAFAGMNLQGSSAKTRGWLGWNPEGPGLIADLKQMDYGQAITR